MTKFITLLKLTFISLFTVAIGVSLGLALLIVSAPIDKKMALTSSIIEPNITRLPGPLYASLINIEALAVPEEVPIAHVDVQDNEEEDDDDGDCS